MHELHISMIRDMELAQREGFQEMMTHFATAQTMAAQIDFDFYMGYPVDQKADSLEEK